MMEIITTPNTILVKKAGAVNKFDKKLKEMLEEMDETLKATNDPVGVGLAAPQVGITKRIFLAREAEDSDVKVFINPRVKKIWDNPKKNKPKKRKRLLEGCLSIPNIWGNVERPKKITVEFQDAEGKKHTQTFNGFLSTVIQHEIDHLNGVLFTKHVIEQKEQLYRSFKNEKGEDEFEEVSL